MTGSWYSFNGEKLANGLANLKEVLRDNVIVIESLRQKVSKLEKDDGLPAIEVEP
jgi:hypothetical protein